MLLVTCNGSMKSHKDLDVYKKSLDLVEDIYKLTRSFPKEEKYGLSSQLQRAGVSIQSNVAEGAARKNNKEFIQFLYIALGSSAEVETQLEIAFRLSYIKNVDAIINNIADIRRLIQGLIRYIKNK